MTTAVTKTPFFPTLENHFGLSIENEVKIKVEKGPDGGSEERLITVWKNPYLVSAITPYTPCEEDEAFLVTCRAAFNNRKNQGASISSGESFFLHHDVSVIILCRIDLKSVVNFSKVSSCMYLAAKQDFVWQSQLSNLLPSVNVIPSNLCIFSPQQQFQIIYRRIEDESKPYQARFKYIEENCHGIREQLQGKKKVDTLISALAEALNKRNKQKLNAHAGENYDGSTASISAGSELGRILHAIEVLIPAAFNHREKFEKVIRQAEVVKNTASSSSTVTVEDVKDT